MSAHRLREQGPPLAPLVRIPAKVEPFAARRLGSTVYLQVRIPTVNVDNTSPPDIVRVEVYGFTGTPPGDDDIIKSGEVVASIPVRPPLTEDEKAAEEDRTKGEEAGKPAREKGKPPSEKGRKGAPSAKHPSGEPSAPGRPPRCRTGSTPAWSWW